MWVTLNEMVKRQVRKRTAGEGAPSRAFGELVLHSLVQEDFIRGALVSSCLALVLLVQGCSSPPLIKDNSAIGILVRIKELVNLDDPTDPKKVSEALGVEAVYVPDRRSTFWRGSIELIPPEWMSRYFYRSSIGKRRDSVSSTFGVNNEYCVGYNEIKSVFGADYFTKSILIEMVMDGDIESRKDDGAVYTYFFHDEMVGGNRTYSLRLYVSKIGCVSEITFVRYRED